MQPKVTNISKHITDLEDVIFLMKQLLEVQGLSFEKHSIRTYDGYQDIRFLIPCNIKPFKDEAHANQYIEYNDLDKKASQYEALVNDWIDTLLITKESK